MLEKLRDVLSKQISTAFHTVIKSFRLFLPLLLAILLTECILFMIFLSFENNISLREKKINEEYDYHLTVTGLTEGEMLLLRNDDRTVSRNAMCFDVIRTIRYDSTYNDPTFTVYIKILTGNKNYGIWGYFIDDSLETNYTAMCLRYYDVFGTEEQPNDHISLSFSPLYTQEEEANRLFTTRTVLLVLVSVVSAAVLLSFYRVFSNEKRFVLGLYSAFGANARNVRIQLMTELLLLATVLLLPSYYVSSLLCALIYRSGGSSYAFSFLSLPALLVVLLCMFFILLATVYSTIKPFAQAEPMKLISAEENAGSICAPAHSQNLLKLPFPFGYELLSILRFRRRYIFLSLISALLSVAFVLGFYFSAVYAGNANIRYQTDADFTVEFSGIKQVDAERISLFKDADGVSFAFTKPSSVHADTLSVLMTVQKDHVTSKKGLGQDKQNGVFYTGDVALISGGVDLADYFSTLYTTSGDTASLLSDKRNVLVGKTFENRETFSFESGDTIVLAIPELDEEGEAIYLDENASKIKNLMGVHFWEAAYEKLSFRYETLTVVGIIEDYPSGAEGVPLVMHPDTYENVTGSSLLANTLTVHMDEAATTEDFLRTEDIFRATAAKLGNCTVHSQESFFENRTERLYCYDKLITFSLAAFVLFIPLLWFYSQTLFFKKREKEFYVLNAISAPLGKIRALYLSSCVILAPVALLSILLSLLIYGGLFLLFERFIPTVLDVSGTVASTVSLPVAVYAVGILVTFLSCILSAIVPYCVYARRFTHESVANNFYEEA